VKSNARFAIEQLVDEIAARHRKRASVARVFATHGFQPSTDWQAYYLALWSATVEAVARAGVGQRGAARLVGPSPYAVRAFW
jgi:hypothetical protein